MKITPHELAELRGLIYEASNATDAPTKIRQHRQMLDRLKLCLSFLEQPHPNDDRLRMALFMLFDSVAKMAGGWGITNRPNFEEAMRMIFEIAGYVEPTNRVD